MVELFIGIGSNTEREKHLKAGITELQQIFVQVELSPVYEAEAVGVCSGNYYNLVVRCQTSLSLTQVSAALQAIEQRWGRRDPRHAGSGCCTLDLDLLLYGRLCQTAKPCLPRPDILHYAFVLRPLADLAPTTTHPQNGLSFATLWQRFRDPTQRLWPVNVDGINGEGINVDGIDGASCHAPCIIECK